MDDLVLAEYIQKKYGNDIKIMFFDILSKTINYHKLTINLGCGSSLTFELNKNKLEENGNTDR